MSFVNPQLFWILAIPLMGFSFFILRHKESFAHIFSEEVLKRLSLGDDSLPLVARNSMIIIALFLMTVALSRPVIDKGEHTVKLSGISALVALDISGSMRAKDIYPNRLEFAKIKIASLFHEMKDDELSLVAFADSAFILAPFSSDKETLIQIIEGVDSNYIKMRSTNLDALGNLSKKILAKKRPKVMILFTDGGDDKEVEHFAELIAEESITLYVVLVGSANGVPVVDKKGKAVVQNGKIVITKRNDSLGAVAMNSSGAYIVANTGTTGIKELVATIKKHHKGKEKGEITLHDRVELFYYPLALAVLLLLVSFSSLPRKKSLQ
jgi:Ca-activated chloride channel family protein